MADVLEYAKELIVQYGWNPGAPAEGGDMEVGSSEKDGFTLHDAIGEACTRLSTATGVTPAKDWQVTTPEGQVRQLRKEAVALVQAQLPEGENDYHFNDQAQSVDEVFAVLDAALAKAEEART